MSRHHHYEPADEPDALPLNCGHQSCIAMRCDECGHQHCAECTFLAHNGVMTCRKCVPVTVALLNREIAELTALLAMTDLHATNAGLLEDIQDQTVHRDGLLKFQAEQAARMEAVCNQRRDASGTEQKPAGYIPPSAAVLARAIIRHAEGR